MSLYYYDRQVAYGEAFIFNNAIKTIIETADIPIALVDAIESGELEKWIFKAGSTAAISAYADYDGTVAGAVLATSTHGLITGTIITIRGTTNYNGIHQITVVDSTHFYFIDTWVADDGASDFDQPARLIAGPEAAGVYSATWQMSVAPDAACKLTWLININATFQPQSVAERDYAINDIDNCSSTCTIAVSVGDIVWLSVQSDSTSDITNIHGNFNLHIS